MGDTWKERHPLFREQMMRAAPCIAARTRMLERLEKSPCIDNSKLDRSGFKSFAHTKLEMHMWLIKVGDNAYVRKNHHFGPASGLSLDFVKTFQSLRNFGACQNLPNVTFFIHSAVHVKLSRDTDMEKVRGCSQSGTNGNIYRVSYKETLASQTHLGKLLKDFAKGQHHALKGRAKKGRQHLLANSSLRLHLSQMKKWCAQSSLGIIYLSFGCTPMTRNPAVAILAINK